MRYKHKIIVEIDGVRHKMVETAIGGDLCKKCSITNECKNLIGIPCVGVRTYFKKETKKGVTIGYGGLK